MSANGTGLMLFIDDMTAEKQQFTFICLSSLISCIHIKLVKIRHILDTIMYLQKSNFPRNNKGSQHITLVARQTRRSRQSVCERACRDKETIKP